MADSLPYHDRPATPRPTIAVVLKGWPRLSETFIAQELCGFEARGLALRLYSLRQPTDGRVHTVNRALRAPVVYLPEYLWRAPLRLFNGWRVARTLPGYRAARAAWRRDLRRDPTPNRIRRFGQALVLAAELDDDVAHIHAHFLHTPSSVARYAALLRNLRWSASAHAKDIWTTPNWEKAEKLRDAAWTVTCTEAGRDHLNALAPGLANPVELVHHGLDQERFPVAPMRAALDGRDVQQPVILLSVGRAVPKKGFEDMLEALARLPAELSWRFVHVGGGPLLKRLKQRAARLGLATRVEWRGSRDEDDVRAAYRQADLFTLASRVTSDGDRDGIPNVIVEAMSQGLPVVATTAGAIPELVVAGETGLLVSPGDTAALASALTELIRDPARRVAFGTAAELRVRRDFPAARGYDRLAALLSTSIACALPSTRR
jgi:glycosyltransferase involved in cell wall biosynthesis